MAKATPLFTLHKGPDNKWSFEYPDRWKAYLASLPPGTYDQAGPRKQKRLRSTQQNGYYFAVIVEIYAQLWSLSKDETHEQLLTGYAVARWEPGRKLAVMRSSDMDVHEAEAYYDWCRTDAQNFFKVWEMFHVRLNVPLPNEVVI